MISGGKDREKRAGQVSLKMCVKAQMEKLSAWHFQIILSVYALYVTAWRRSHTLIEILFPRYPSLLLMLRIISLLSCCYKTRELTNSPSAKQPVT